MKRFFLNPPGRRPFGAVVLTLAFAVGLAAARAQAPPTNAAPAAAAPGANPAPPPSAAPQRSQADLEKLVAPIALYPDQLLATVLPASAYPLEIVQAARFVKDTNNIAKLDARPWDENVKAVARFPEVINQMNDNIQWTSDLGDAFINQPKGITDAIQTMRIKAQESGALKTTPQQVVTVTNTVIEKTVESQTVFVTNQVVQIQPSDPEVIYVPQYNPTVVYAGYPVAYPGYYYPPAPYYPVAATAVTFGLGMAAGAIIANNCDWGHGGCWGGSYHSDVDIDVNRKFETGDINVNRNRNNVNVQNRQKWQPDQSRLRNSGSTLSSAQNRETRGFSQPSAASTRQSLAQSERQLNPTGNRASRPGASPNVNRPAQSPNVNRPSQSPNVNRPSQSPGVSRQPSPGAGASRPSSPNVSRPSPSHQSAFSGAGGGGGGARHASARGAASRGGGHRGGGGRR